MGGIRGLHTVLAGLAWAVICLVAIFAVAQHFTWSWAQDPESWPGFIMLNHAGASLGLFMLLNLAFGIALSDRGQ